uniref:Secreted protein n=1 Tax=Steinernema glaseri TaxID=37863 RepID=A0A1I7YMJ6_9BILA
MGYLFLVAPKKSFALKCCDSGVKDIGAEARLSAALRLGMSTSIIAKPYPCFRSRSSLAVVPQHGDPSSAVFIAPD